LIVEGDELMVSRLRQDELDVTIMSREYPPDIYGGAGVHVDYLSRSLAKIMGVEVRCFGKARPGPEGVRVRAYEPWDLTDEVDDRRFTKALGPLSVNLAMMKEPITGDVVHCHTWYTFMAGFYAKKLYGQPLVTTIHSLEPLRPWKEEQLGNAYRLSSWMERTGVEASDCVIAVSSEMKKDILKCYDIAEEKVRVIHNGIDLDEYRRVDTDIARCEYGIWEDYILFVGRMSRQKGIFHLLDADFGDNRGVCGLGGCCQYHVPRQISRNERLAPRRAHPPRARCHLQAPPLL
jgi:starch synthase